MQRATTFFISIVLLILSTSNAFAQDKAKATPDKDKVDISDIEKKYWAPKDTDFTVVQNRTYSKEKRFSVAAQYGVLVNDPYSEASVLGVHANYFFSERYGAELMYYSYEPEDNDNIDQLEELGVGGAKPNHNKIKQFYGAGFNWVPFYAKMSFLGKSIIYFDMAFTPVIGMTNYDQQTDLGPQNKSALTYGLDVTQYFFFSKHLAVRVDLSNRWHTEEVVKFRSPAGAKLNDNFTNTTTLMLGMTWYF